MERDNIVVDGAGYTLQGTGSGTGIDVTGRSNVTINNTKIKIFDWGVNLYSSSNNSIFASAPTYGTTSIHGAQSLFDDVIISAVGLRRAFS